MENEVDMEELERLEALLMDALAVIKALERRRNREPGIPEAERWKATNVELANRLKKALLCSKEKALSHVVGLKLDENAVLAWEAYAKDNGRIEACRGLAADFRLPSEIPPDVRPDPRSKEAALDEKRAQIARERSRNHQAIATDAASKPRLMAELRRLRAQGRENGAKGDVQDPREDSSQPRASQGPSRGSA